MRSSSVRVPSLTMPRSATTHTRGHVFCSFLALVLRKELQDRLERAGHGDLARADIVNGLRSISEFDLTSGGKTFTVRTSASGAAAHAITAAGAALPPIIRRTST